MARPGGTDHIVVARQVLVVRGTRITALMSAEAIASIRVHALDAHQGTPHAIFSCYLRASEVDIFASLAISLEEIKDMGSAAWMASGRC
jgi:hypothetical protein